MMRLTLIFLVLASILIIAVPTRASELSVQTFTSDLASYVAENINTLKNIHANFNILKKEMNRYAFEKNKVERESILSKRISALQRYKKNSPKFAHRYIDLFVSRLQTLRWANRFNKANEHRILLSSIQSKMSDIEPYIAWM